MAGTQLSRLKMDKKDKSGTSTKCQRLLRVESTTSHSISRAQESQMNSKYTAPTQIGGKYLSSKTASSPMSRTTEFLKSMETKTSSIKKLLSTREVVVRTKDGRLYILIKPIKSKLKA
jgi:hypothetical protein